MTKRKKFFYVCCFMLCLCSMACFGTGIRAEAKTTVIKSSSFKSCYNRVLSKTYGVFKRTQTGKMKTWEDQWLKCTGLMGASVYDYDRDGKKEMLVIVAKDVSSETQNKANIILQMYEQGKEGITLASEMPFSSYDTKDVVCGCISGNQWSEDRYFMNLVTVGKHTYLVCEEVGINGAFADGLEEDYWILEYVNGKFRYVSSLTQTAGGSSDFVYHNFKFKNGKMIGKELYFAETSQKGKCKSYKDSIIRYFNNAGIKVNASQLTESGSNTSKSILSKSNAPKNLFSFYNKWLNQKVAYKTQVYKFRAAVTSKNKF